ncbi:MAG TPA: penicillin-binding transpeptidase domain-containing protein, partial [Candidatus Omnitrophota bacterium]|nr:penicillin-binding transpeptidase domain-containing protein [Candidatus Omnitrophota bacterium]
MYFRKRSLRFILLFIFFILFFGFFTLKLVLIQVFRSSYLNHLAQKQQTHVITLAPKRGTIYDRQFRPLALDIAAYSLYAAPRMMKPADIEKAIDVLPRTIGLDKDLLRERLTRDKGFVWLARKLSLDDMEKVLAFKLRGIHFMKESKRSYPGHEAAAHLVGFAGTDGHGLEGLELKFDKLLAGREGAAQILRDARQQDLLIEQALLKPQDGFDLILTIDDNIQYFVEQALAKGFQRHRAMSASVVVLNPRTGEVLALANRPTYDLNEFGKSHEDQRKNRAVCDMYEPGSVFKVVLTSAALEKGIVQETDKVFCENGAYRIVNHTLHDHHAHGTLTFREVVEQSSNIGVVKIAQKLGGPVFNDYAQRFGFGKRT